MTLPGSQRVCLAAFLAMAPLDANEGQYYDPKRLVSPLVLQKRMNALQGEELEPARIKAEKAGVKQIFIDDLREDFVANYVFPMFR